MGKYSKIIRLYNEAIWYIDTIAGFTDYAGWTKEEAEEFEKALEKASSILRKVRSRLRGW